MEPWKFLEHKQISAQSLAVANFERHTEIAQKACANCAHFPGNVRIVEPPNGSQGDLAIINEENNGGCHTREGVVHRSRDLDQEDKMRWIHIHRIRNKYTKTTGTRVSEARIS